MQLAGSEPTGHAAAALRLATSVTGPEAIEGQIIALPADVKWPTGDWNSRPVEAIVIAVPGPQGTDPAGILVLGLNPFRRNDSDIINVARLIAGQLGAAYGTIVALENERRRADRIWSVSRDIIVVLDGAGTLRSVSPSWSRILGHPPHEVVGRQLAEFVHPEDVANSRFTNSQVHCDQGLSSQENRLRTVDGSYRNIEWHTTSEDGLVYGYGRDVTDRRAFAQELNSSREQFRHLVQGVVDYAIYMIDLEGHVSSWNEGARRIKGYEPDEIIGEHFSRFYTDEDRIAGAPAQTLEIARREGRFSAEGWRVRKNGERFRASVVLDAIRDDSGRPIGFAKITRDITEKENAQRDLEATREALFQSQKMEAIGQLTGGIAHDFNNLLMAVLSSLELLAKRIPDDPTSRRLLNNAIEGAQRGATLTQRMLMFARKKELAIERIEVPALLAGMNDLVQRSIGPEWPISTSFPLKLPPVRADGNQLETALLNLIVNARDAMPSGGPIVISATREALKKSNRSSLPEGDYVRLVVRDEGLGMDAETLRRATEPFFTTKGVGKGTGLGLPMVHGMAQKLGGTFEIESKPGSGTSAILWLPVEEVEMPVSRPATVKEFRPQTSQLKVLAVDDDPLILMNTASLLEDLGHEVIEAHSGTDALSKFRAGNDIDLVITDQAMPKMTGTDLITAIFELRPEMPAIIASGYGEGIEMPRRQVVRLGKPFGQVQLAKAIDEAVGKKDLGKSHTFSAPG
ncbi:PAS domain S-box protein (plasmid) [Pelagibacterium sp. H642]|nr:PAS domain S-box protein [Pelagibacterium sp. H642]